MNARPQIIFYEGKPAFVVIPYAEYVALTFNKTKKPKIKDDLYVPQNFP